MITQKEKQATLLSPTKKDYYQIWNELLQTASKLSNRWDPSSTNESDPGIVLLKLLTAIADKLNYNIDKNTLEAFMPSASQEQSMRKLCEMMGYNMGYYKSATGEATISFAGGEWQTNGTLQIKKFANITNKEATVNYFLLQDAQISKQTPTVKVKVMQGQVVKCQPNNNYLITIAQLDDNFRYYFPETQIAENGIFIQGGVTQEQVINQEWTLIDNLNTRLPNSFVYAFGYDSKRGLPYIQFPQTINELIGNGLQISYVRTQGLLGNVQRAQLSALVQGVTYPDFEGNTQTQPAENFKVVNNSAIVNGADKQSIDEAYNNYKKTIGTFDTLVTCRDYMNAIYKMTQTDESTTPLVSNVNVTDIRSDLNYALTLCTFDDSGIAYEDTTSTTTKNTGSKINNFDLIVYPFNKVFDANKVDEKGYSKSFTNDSSILTKNTLEARLSDYKTISHVFNYPKPTDIIAIKNYYKIKANITTTKKVNAIQQKEILENVKTALCTAFNMRRLDFGQQLPFDSILQTIQGADTRIRNVAMFEPQVITKFATQEGFEYSLTARSTLSEDEVDKAKEYYNKLALRNLIAGRIAWFDYDTSFIHTWTEEMATGNIQVSTKEQDGETWGNPTSTSISALYPTPPANDAANGGSGGTGGSGGGSGGGTSGGTGGSQSAHQAIVQLDGTLLISAAEQSKDKLPTISGSSATTELPAAIKLAANEYVQFKAPNYSTQVTYPAYVNYYFHSNTTKTGSGAAQQQTTRAANFMQIKQFIKRLMNGFANTARCIGSDAGVAYYSDKKYNATNYDFYLGILKNNQTTWPTLLTGLDIPFEHYYGITATVSEGTTSYSHASEWGCRYFKVTSTGVTLATLPQIARGDFIADKRHTPSDENTITQVDGFNIDVFCNNLNFEAFYGHLAAQGGATCQCTETEWIPADTLAILDANSGFKLASQTAGFASMAAFLNNLTYKYLPATPAPDITTPATWNAATNVPSSASAKMLYISQYTSTNIPGERIDEYGYKFIPRYTDKAKQSDPWTGYFVPNMASGYTTNWGYGENGVPYGVTPNAQYTLKAGQYLLITYTPSDSSDPMGNTQKQPVYEAYGQGAIIKPNFKLVDSQDASIIKSKHLTMSLADAFGAAAWTPSGADDGIVLPASKDMAALGVNDQIEIRKVVAPKIGIDDNNNIIQKNFYFYFILNKYTQSNSGLKQFNLNYANSSKTISNSSGSKTYYKYRYELAPGEYFLYTDSNRLQMAYYGSGSEVICWVQRTQAPSSADDYNLTFLSYNGEQAVASKILEQGLDSVQWIPKYFVNSFVQIQEYQYITLTQGDELIKLSTQSNYPEIVACNQYMPVTQTTVVLTGDEAATAMGYQDTGVYRFAGEQETKELPFISADEGWQVRTRLGLQVGPNSPQTIRHDGCIQDILTIGVVDLNSVTVNSQDVPTATTKYTFAPGNDALPEQLSFKTNTLVIEPSGKSQIDARTIKQQQLQGLKFLMFKQHAPTIKTPTNGGGGGAGSVNETLLPLNNFNESYTQITVAGIAIPATPATAQPIVQLPAIVPTNSLGIVMFYAQSVQQGMTNFRLESGNPSTPTLCAYLDLLSAAASTWTNTITLKAGLNIIALKQSDTLKIYSHTEVGSSHKLIFGGLDIVREGDNGVGFNQQVIQYELTDKPTLRQQLYEDLQALLGKDSLNEDRVNQFYFNHIAQPDVLMNVGKENTIKQLSDPLAYFDYNNINNNFVISQIDPSSYADTNAGIIITNSSKLTY